MDPGRNIPVTFTPTLVRAPLYASAAVTSRGAVIVYFTAANPLSIARPNIVPHLVDSLSIKKAEIDMLVAVNH